MTSRPAPGSPALASRWYLESFVEGGPQLRRITLQPLPFRVGRLPGLALPLASDSVSKEHAEFFLRDDALRVRDLGSKNGTFVNGERVGEAPVREGDILHFAQVEFRVGRQEIDDESLEPSTVSLSEKMKLPEDLPKQFPEDTRELPELLSERRVTSVFQPIVSLPSGKVVGYEALGRGTHARLPEAPQELFRIAKSIGAEADLSRLFRETALGLAVARGSLPALFLNVDAAELEKPGLVSEVVEARQRALKLRLTLEVKEEALADLASVDRLRSQLSRASVGIAYDKFGAGQARLLELAEVPPHYLKFDRSFVGGIDSAPSSRRRLLTSLVSVARDLLVQTVAVGVETAAEADVCMHIGFTHAQGYFFGRPRPVEQT